MAKACRVHLSLLGRVAVIENSRSGAGHAHPHPHLLLKLAGSDGCFEINGRLHPITDSRAILVNSWEPHTYHHTDGARPTLMLAVYFDSRVGPASGVTGESMRFASSFMPVTRSVRSSVETMVHELDHCSGRSTRAVEDALRALLDAAPTEWRDAPDEAGWPARAQGRSRLDRRVSRCMEYMRDHLDAREDLRRLGARFGLSRPHLFHLFRQSMQVTPAMFWNTLRMEFAVTRLARRDASVGGLAQDLGFSDQGNFTRFFHAIQGMPPSQYHAAALGTTSPARAATL